MLVQVELEDLKFSSHLVKTEQGLVNLYKSDEPNPCLKLNTIESYFYNQMRKGAKLCDIIINFQKQPGLYKFKCLHDLLDKLCIEGLLLNSNIKMMMQESSESAFFNNQNYSLPSIKERIIRFKNKFLKKHSRSHAMTILNDENLLFTDRLKSLPLLRNLPEPIFNKILKNASFHVIKNKFVLCREGDESKDLFILIAGQIGVYKFCPKIKKHRLITLLNEGSIIGEAGFFMGKNRTATLMAIGECKVVIVKHDTSFIQSQATETKLSVFQKRLWYLQALASSEFFSEVPPEALDLFLRLGNIRELAENEWIYRENTTANSLCILIQGECEISEKGQAINNLSKGAVIGEIAVLSHGTLRTVSVKTTAPALICEIPSDQIWNFFSVNLIFAKQVEQLARERVNNYPGSYS